MAANHPQMSTALKNIADLNAVYLQHQRESLKAAEEDTRREKARSSKKSSKKSRKKDSKRKDKKSRKDKKEKNCLLYTSPSPRDMRRSRMPSSA